MIYDELGRHLPAAGSVERAVVPMGMYLAWCVNLNLISSELMERAQQGVLRVRYREITGAELLASGCGGVLDARWLSAAGREFSDRYYAGYLDDFRAVFGDEIYRVTDDWAHYDQLAPLLTKHLYGPRSRAREPARNSAWWKFWA